MKNLFIGYFHTPTAKRREVLHVISSVLGLTPEEVSEVRVTSLRGGGGGVKLNRNHQTCIPAPEVISFWRG